MGQSLSGLAILALGALAMVSAEPDKKPRTPHTPRLSHLDNGTLRLGVDLNLGGAIVYLAPSGTERNLVNNWDFGRQIQMSYYACPVPYLVGDKKPSKHWEHLGWNPVQAGDDFGHGSRVLEHRNDGKELYVRCVPMQWPLDNEPAECTFESWITLDGPTVQVRCRLRNARKDTTWYPARIQELPAVYTNGPYYRLMTYTGDRPFSGAPLTRIEKAPENKGPWSTWQATENWAALVNDDNWGLGVWHPGCYRFSGGFAGKPGQGGTRDSPTGYLAPNRIEHLDANIEHEYSYQLIVGSLDAIRAHVVRHASKPKPPQYDFSRDRQGWHLVHGRDTGWPIQGDWHLRLEEKDPYALSPPGFWHADEAGTLYVEAAFQTKETQAKVYWSTFRDAGHAEGRSRTFQIEPDGRFHLYKVPLAEVSTYQGIITGLRLDPIPDGHPGATVRLRSLGFRRPDPKEEPPK